MKSISTSKLTACMGLLAVLLLLFRPLAAQPPTHHITGKVTTQSTGSPIGGATIMVKGTRNATQTADDGSFTIDAAPGEHLVISFIGYLKQELTVGNSVAINIALTQDINNMNDVIVVGYGKMKKSDLSSAVVTISSADLEMEARNGRMQEYLNQARHLLSGFDSFSLHQISRSRNRHVDSLAALATSSAQSFPLVILVEDLCSPTKMKRENVQIHQLSVGPS